MKARFDKIGYPLYCDAGPYAGDMRIDLTIRLYLSPEEYARYEGSESLQITLSESGGGGSTAESSGELPVGDVVAVGEAALAVARPAGWTPVSGGLDEVRADEHRTRPCRPAAASRKPETRRPFPAQIKERPDDDTQAEPRDRPRAGRHAPPSISRHWPKGVTSSMDRIELNVTINGTDMNPWHRFGLRQNPFPQIGKAEYAAGESKLASLDGDPVRTADDIRERLAGFDPEFVEGVIQRWRPGRRVRFKIVFPGGRNTAEPSGELSVGESSPPGSRARRRPRRLDPVRGGLTRSAPASTVPAPCQHPAPHRPCPKPPADSPGRSRTGHDCP